VGGRALRWGTSRERRAAGLVLLVSGAVAVAGSNTWVLLLLLAGTLAHAAGWAILPGAGWRRILAMSIATPATWLLLSGPRFAVVAVVGYLGWMLVRERSPLATLTTALPLGVALAAGGAFGGAIVPYDRMLPVLAATAGALVAGAWLAAAIDRGLGRRRSRRADGSGPPVPSQS
jgi:hypothetical protein